MTRRMMLFAYGTREPLRELSEDEQAMYQALLDTFNPPEKEHGVVEGRIFGHDGLVYAEAPGQSQTVTLMLTLDRQLARKLKALAHTRGLDADALVAQLIDEQPTPFGLAPRFTVVPGPTP